MDWMTAACDSGVMKIGLEWLGMEGWQCQSFAVVML